MKKISVSHCSSLEPSVWLQDNRNKSWGNYAWWLLTEWCVEWHRLELDKGRFFWMWTVGVGEILRNVWGHSRDFTWNLRGLSNYFSRIFEVFLGIFWGLLGSFLQIFWWIYEELLRTSYGFSKDFSGKVLRTTWEFSKDFLRTFWGFSEEIMKTS